MYNLSKARIYEVENKINNTERPLFHVTAKIGWCNDPNGWSYYDGKYHLFYQYHPYSVNWGPMHWGHVTTTDFLHWNYEKCALAPDTAIDNKGCFSGGAIEWNNKMILLYTGVSEHKQEDGSDIEIQQQCLAVLKDDEFIKSKNNPVISCNEQPEGSSIKDFRDPYLFVKDDILYALIAARGKNGHGRLLLYSAETLEKWNFVQVVAENDGSIGSMWECPSVFSVGNKDIILISPQFSKQSLDNRFHCGNDVVMLVGNWNDINKPFQIENYIPVDSGLDFYAPQVVKTPDGRIVMIGWMQNWDHCYPPENAKWYGQMSLPRELFIDDLGYICQKPICELDKIRKLRNSYKNVVLDHNSISLENVHGRILDIDIIANIKETSRFGVRVAKNEEFFTEVRFDIEDKLLRIDRRHAGAIRDALELKEVPLVDIGDKLNLRLVLDRYSLEVFIENGRQVASIAIYNTPLSADGIEFFAKGKSKFDINTYDLEI